MNFLNREIPSFHAAALILGSAALASKLLGLFRDRLLASRFGAGDTLDIYYAAFQIPDLLFTVFLIGAAAAAVLPIFLQYERWSGEAAERFISNLLTIFSVGATAIVLLAIFFTPWLAPLVAPGFDAGKMSQLITLTRLMLFAAVFLGMAGILSVVLQARHRFIVFALPPIFYNLGIILGILVFVPLVGVRGLAGGVLAGGALQVLVQIPFLRAMQFKLRASFDLHEPGLHQVLKLSVPRVAALGMSQLTLTALAAIASLFSSGSIAVLRLAANLIYVPVGLFGVSWALATFPKLTNDALAGRGAAFGAQFALGVRNILFWTLPAAAMAIVLRAHIVRVVLGSGVFDWEDTRLVAAALAVLSVAIISESLLPLVLRAFYALGKTREPLVWDIAGSLLTVGLALSFSALFTSQPEALAWLARLLRIGDLSSPRILAVALGFALGSLANLAGLCFALGRVLRIELGARLSFEPGAAVLMAGAAVLGGLAAYGALMPFPSLVDTRTFLGIAAQGVTAGLIGFAVYGVALWLQGNAELAGLRESFRRRLISPAKTPGVYETEKLDGDAGR